MLRYLFVLLIPMCSARIMAQELFSIRGTVTDEKGEPLFGASIAIHELKTGTATDKSGEFIIEGVAPGQYHLHISYLGYQCVHHNVVTVVDSDVYAAYHMKPEQHNIEEVVVIADSHTAKKKRVVASLELADREYLQNNINSSLMKNLAGLPGVSAIEIGQGFSKPVIRGLSFNRVAVSENGIKQEGQQWGADHGLEIDQFAVEGVQVVKGPSSLQYGSEAIGGVIQILPVAVPDTQTVEGSVQFVGKSLNRLYGVSALCKYRKQHWYSHIRYTQMDFGDYRVPADSFFYNRFRLPIYDQTLKNTAGNEKDIYFATGLIHNSYKTTLNISNVNSHTGFFPGAHGIPDAATLTPDSSRRNIGLPYQSVNHLKIISNTVIYLPAGLLAFDFGYQNNHREEWSLFHSHYPGQEPPENNTDLELAFDLDTWSGGANYKLRTGKHELTTGAEMSFQRNAIAGYMFLLPEYRRSGAGIYLLEAYRPNRNLTLSGGIRFDYGRTDIMPYYSNYTETLKSPDFNAEFRDISWAAGVSYSLSNTLNLKSNIGKSFRIPNASELSANGIHHGSFRYEVGDTGITSEYSYQIDIGLFYSGRRLQIEASPFVNYFPNFIFLSPTGSYLHPAGFEIREADAGQVYQYKQSEAFRAGGELSVALEPVKRLKIQLSGEYVYATDMTYPIPFTPPLHIASDMRYTLTRLGSRITEPTIRLSASYTSAQNRNARNELRTPASTIADLAFTAGLHIGGRTVSLWLQIQNLFDTKYYNHLSFYRLIELPEPGRNYQVMIKIPFTDSKHSK